MSDERIIGGGIWESRNPVSRDPNNEPMNTSLVSYEVYRNRTQGAVIIQPTDYHAGNIVLTKDGLTRLLASLD